MFKIRKTQSTLTKHIFQVNTVMEINQVFSSSCFDTAHLFFKSKLTDFHFKKNKQNSYPLRQEDL